MAQQNTSWKDAAKRIPKVAGVLGGIATYGALAIDQTHKFGWWKVGLVSAIGAVVLIIAVLRAKKIKFQRPIVIALVGLLVAGAVGVFFVPGGPSEAASKEQAASVPPTHGATGPSEEGEPLNHVCQNADPAAQFQPTRVDVCVMFWCEGTYRSSTDGSDIPGRGQIKLRPLIYNGTSRPLDLSIANPAAVRLLVSTDRPPGDWWQPHQATRQQGDHPLAVTRPNGQMVWSIPPNQPGDSVLIKLPNGMETWDSFATLKWDYGVKGPGETASKPLRFDENQRPVQEGDLVFDVPRDDKSRVIGLAVVDRKDPTNPTPLAFRPRNEWPKDPSDLNSF